MRGENARNRVYVWPPVHIVCTVGCRKMAENFGVSVIFVSERFAKFREPPKIVTASPYIERKQRDLFNSYTTQASLSHASMLHNEESGTSCESPDSWLSDEKQLALALRIDMVREPKCALADCSLGAKAM
jgi:hypothetical protein